MRHHLLSTHPQPEEPDHGGPQDHQDERGGRLRTGRRRGLHLYGASHQGEHQGPVLPGERGGGAGVGGVRHLLRERCPPPVRHSFQVSKQSTSLAEAPGCVKIIGAVFTINVAVLLNTLPYGFVTLTVYVAASVDCTVAIV